MSDAAARERALPCERMFPGTWADLGRTDCPVHDTLADALAAEQERIRRLERQLDRHAHGWREEEKRSWAAEKRTRQLEKALTRLANPTSTPKTEEAALLQIEVEQIAREALDV